MIKLLAISDTYIPAEVMRRGFSGLADLGVQVEVRRWEHAALPELQEANLAIEQGGPDAVALPAEVIENVADFDIIAVQFAPVGRRLIEAAANLKAICVLRSGTENIDVAYATQRGAAVLNTPGRNARAVAECTVGLILAELRNLARAHAAMKNRQWSRAFPNQAAIPELLDRTIGLVGYGAVARLVAHFLNAFGCRILAYDPFAKGDAAPAKLVALDQLLAESDVVSLHARLTDETHHLIGRRELALMKPSAVLVNTARSGLVDEPALIEALGSRQIMGAALDVFDVEPLPPDSPFFTLDNVTLAPHLAGSTIDAFHNSPKMMAAHLRRLLTGQGNLPIVNAVEPKLRAL